MESMRVCAGGVPVRPLPNPRLVCEAGVKGWRATPVVAVELLLFSRSSLVPPVLGPGTAVVLMVPPRARKLYVELCCLGAVLPTSFWVPVWMPLPVLWLCGHVARVLSLASAVDQIRRWLVLCRMKRRERGCRQHVVHSGSPSVDISDRAPSVVASGSMHRPAS